VRLASILMSAALLACAGVSPETSGVAAFSQSQCLAGIEQLDQGRRERVEWSAAAGRLIVRHRDAHFRCEQRVTVLLRRTGTAIDLLVQPADMDPPSVAKCDCLYDISFEVPGLEAGTYDVTLSRRLDNRHSPNVPIRIGSERITVP
jgi:hypothetical protein